MSKKTIRESLLELDRKFLGTDKYKDLTALYESQDISGKDKATLKKLINDIKDKEDLQDAIMSVLQEEVNDDFDYDETPEWEMTDKKSVLDYDSFWTDYSLWHNLITDEWVCIFGDIDLYNPVTTYSDAEFETEDEAREWFENYTGFEDDTDLDEDFKTDGWQDVYKPYSGAEYNFQTLLQNNKKVGYIEYHDNDGDWSYCAYLNISDKNNPTKLEDYELLGNFKSREEAQKAIENKLGLKEWYAGEPADEVSYHPTKGNISDISDLKIGDKIYHSSYGEGVVDNIKDGKVYIIFDNNQRRIFQGKGITYLNEIYYPNGEAVTSLDLDTYLDYMYGTDRDKDNNHYTEEEKQRAVDYWFKKHETLFESDTLNDDEFDYFAVYEGEILQGEYPTYFDAKENCKGNSCIIKGVKQYGPNEYEETPLTEDYDNTEDIDYVFVAGMVTSDFDSYENRHELYDDSFSMETSEEIDKLEKTLKSKLSKIYNNYDFYVDCIEEDEPAGEDLLLVWFNVSFPSNIDKKDFETNVAKIVNDTYPWDFIKEVPNYDDIMYLKDLVADAGYEYRY